MRSPWFAQSGKDRVRNRLEISVHFRIVEANDAIVLRLEETRALCVARKFGIGRMRGAVGLDDQLAFAATKTAK
jgi:hypothetical protein